MATAESVKAKIQGLINTANETTGGADTDLISAVNTLAAGFGQGGGGDVSGIYMAKITPSSNMSSLTIQHNLGTTDILIAACFVETFGDITPTFNGALGKWWAKTDIPNNRSGVGFDTLAAYNTANAYATLNAPTSRSYWDEVKDENTFEFWQAGSSTAKYITGVTYTVIIVAASVFSGV